VSGDAKWALGVGAVVVAVLCAAWIVSHVLITLGTVIRADLHELRESLERAACGEFARVSPGPIAAAPRAGWREGRGEAGGGFLFRPVRAGPGAGLAGCQPLRHELSRLSPLQDVDLRHRCHADVAPVDALQSLGDSLARFAAGCFKVAAVVVHQGRFRAISQFQPLRSSVEDSNGNRSRHGTVVRNRSDVKFSPLFYEGKQPFQLCEHRRKVQPPRFSARSARRDRSMGFGEPSVVADSRIPSGRRGYRAPAYSRCPSPVDPLTRTAPSAQHIRAPRS